MADALARLLGISKEIITHQGGLRGCMLARRYGGDRRTARAARRTLCTGNAHATSTATCLH
jgi:hypothetical protein